VGSKPCGEKEAYGHFHPAFGEDLCSCEVTLSMRLCDMRDARSRICFDDVCERRCTQMVAAWCFCRGLLVMGSVGLDGGFVWGWRGGVDDE